MEQVTHSPFLQALGYAIINSLWQYALLWLVYVIIHSLCKLPAHQKYVSGLFLQIAGFTWFSGTFLFFYHEFSQIGNSYLYPQTPGSLEVSSSQAVTNSNLLLWVLQTEKLLPYLSIAYLALLLFLSLKWLQAYRYTQAVKTRGLQKIEVNWRLFVQQLSLQLGIKRNVFIFISEIVKTPLTIGFFKPVILIPLASINHLNTEQMEAVILHELAHIKRFDYITNLFLTLIEAILFFNPFMQLISGHIKRERENCCDDWVLQYEYNAASYATALLQIATCQASSKVVLALKATEDKQVLLLRIKRMIEKKDKSFFYYKHQLMALIVMTTVFSSLAYLSPAKKINNSASTSIHALQAIQPLAAKIENPLFNPVYFLIKPGNAVVIQRAETKTGAAIVLERTTNRNVEPPILKKTGEKTGLIPVRPIIDADVSYREAPDVEQKDIDYPLSRAIELARPITLLSKKNQAILQKHLARLAEVAVNEKKESTVREEQVRDEMETALQQIKELKLQIGAANLTFSFRNEVRNIKNENVVEEITGKNIDLKKELKLLARQIQKEIEEVKLQYNSLNQVNADFNLNFNVPGVSDPARAERSGSFSYEYHEKPRLIGAPAPLVNNCLCPKAKQKKTEAKPADDDTELTYETPVPAIERPMPKATIRAKKVYIIKI
ncbi:MAG: regulatory sensor-transducer, BlaR1/MecR1 family [Segetibacter sp.]|nr:regulatory sensor-transducer, BlaR1/MecR1 family [Segetibacter sp.]